MWLLQLPGLADGHLLAIHPPLIVGQTLGQQMSVQLRKGSHLGEGHQEVAPGKAHTVLYPPFSWPCPGVQKWLSNR